MELSCDSLYTEVYREQGGFRYQGPDPYNYIIFNDELWRIIGVFEEDTHRLPGEYLVKIIRSEPIGQYAWDENGYSDWSWSSLSDYLNTDYYWLSFDYPSKILIEYITWKLGGVMPYYGDTIDSFYSDERGTEVYIGNTTAKYDGYIGLMYPSDYGYAAPESSCPRTMNYENYGSSGCYDQNWLYLNGLTQWTLTHHRYWDYDVFVVSHTGYINTSDYGVAWSGGYVRPSLYLKSDTGFTSGNGSIDDPYIIN